MARRRLLYLARDIPVPVSSAARLRTFNWLLHLSRDFRITLVAPAWSPPSPRDRDILASYCERVWLPRPDVRRGWLRRLVTSGVAEAWSYLRGLPPEAWHLQRGNIARIVRREIATQAFDVAFAERWTWGPLIVDAAPLTVLDVGGLQGARRLHHLAGSRNPLRRLARTHLERRFARAELRTLERAGLVLVRGQHARDELLESGSESLRVAVLPPGVDTEHFAPRSTARDPRCVVFPGPLHTPTQRDALQHFHAELLPRIRRRIGNVRLLVLDDDPGPEHLEMLQRDPDVRFTGRIVDSRQELWRSACAVLPLRLGAGSASRLARLLAMGIPTVATPLAARGLDVASGDGVLFARSGAEFVTAVVQVLGDPSLRQDLARRGRETAERRLSLHATYERLTATVVEATRRLEGTASG